MNLRKLIAIAVPITFVALANPASAITLFPQQACLPGSGNFAPGWADSVDAGNASRTDDAVVCVNQFNAGNGIPAGNTAAFQNELANVGSHEFGHLIGLAHGDGAGGGPGASLMDVVFPFSGLDRGWTAAAETAKLNALAAPVQVVWLDFQAAQPGLLSHFLPWSSSPELANHGIVGGPAIAAAEAAIIAAIVADFAGPWTNITFSFHNTAAAASAAATGSGQAAGAYSTVSFVAIPEPATALLVLGGACALAFGRRRARRSLR
jgi:hypothetical protein